MLPLKFGLSDLFLWLSQAQQNSASKRSIMFIHTDTGKYTLELQAAT
jgi:hypothetical protein